LLVYQKIIVYELSNFNKTVFSRINVYNEEVRYPFLSPGRKRCLFDIKYFCSREEGIKKRSETLHKKILKTNDQSRLRRRRRRRRWRRRSEAGGEEKKKVEQRRNH
jgi:hypothetical protein